MSLKKIIYTMPMFLLFITVISAQNVGQANNTKQAEEAKAEIEKRATALLERITEQSQSLKLTENRIYVKTTTAEILWTRDEKRARQLYSEAASEISSAMNESSDEEPYSNRIQWLIQLRTSFIEQLAHKDPEFALNLLRNTRPPARQLSNYNSGWDPESQLESRIASLIAARDPKRALEMAREILKKGFQYELISVLQNLHTKDKESYNTLLKEIIAKLKSENLATNQSAANLAINLLSILKSHKEEEACKELVMALVSAVTKASSRTMNQNDVYAVRNLLTNLRSYMEDIEKYAPSQMPALKKKFAEAEETSEPYMKEMNTLNELTQKGTIEDLLEAASKASKEYRNQFYSHAMWKALNQGDYALATQIAESADIDPWQKKQLLAQISNQQIYKFINDGKINEARQMMTSIKNVQEAVQVYINLVNNVAAKGDKETALSLLSEASSLINEQPKNYAEMNAKMQIARAYIQLNPDRSFELIASSLPQLNELIAAMIALNGFENNYLRDGELPFTYYGGLSNTVNEFQQQIAELANKDYDRAIALAEGFQRDEIRLKGLLTIAQTTLSKSNSGQNRSIEIIRSGVIVER